MARRDDGLWGETKLGESWAIEPKIIERVTHFSDPCLNQVNFLKLHG